MLDDTRWLLRLAAVALAGCIVSLLWLDHPVAHWVATHDTKPDTWSFLLSFFEYATGFEPWRWLGTIVLIAGVVITWSVPRWHRYAKPWLFVLLAHFIATNAMMWGKHFSGRVRPHEWHWGSSWFQHGGSFPSGHVSLVGSIAIPLGVLFPKARLPMIGVLIFVGCARVAVSAHWCSDVFGGIALVALVSYVCEIAVRRAPWPSDQRS